MITLHPAQHGFCKGRSTCTNLLECLKDWTSNLLSGHGTVVMYIDFSKAFYYVLYNLQSSEHINIIVAKAHQRANALLRCFIQRDTN